MTGVISIISTTAYAETNAPQFVKVKYPIYINGAKSNVEAYNCDGSTYLKMSDIKEKLKNLRLMWDDETKSVYIAEKTGFGVLEYQGKNM
ncbi:hypothetical protein [Fusibacter sp. 3D3]|uniref:hypothetical protein n=1 Tax=Fusibacter sp. 3D3 TaxID=1048380 RepID=UPI000852D643|nr:hypothetical protein [Fusibacter sp. 3D3]